MDEKSAQVIRPLLGEGEELLWAGKPATGIRLGPIGHDYLIFIIGLGISVGAFLGILMTIEHKEPIPIISLTIVFVAAGLYLSIGRLLVKARKRGRTDYGLTNQRIIFVSDLFNGSVESLPLDALDFVESEIKEDGSGTILLERRKFGLAALFSYKLASKFPFILPMPDYALEFIQEAGNVYNQILEAQKKLRESATD